MKRKKNEEYQESQLTVIYIFGSKLYFAQKHILKNSCLSLYTIKFYLCVSGYLKHSNDATKLNIHKYTNYNIIEIYISKLSTTTQIFIAMDVREVISL